MLNYYRYYIAGNLVFDKIKLEYYDVVTKGHVFDQLQNKNMDEINTIINRNFVAKERNNTFFDFSKNKSVFLEYILDFGAELKFLEGYPIDTLRRKVHINQGDKYYSILLKGSQYYRYSVVYFIGDVAYGISYVFE